MAEQLKRNGAAFYRKVAKGISDFKNSELFCGLVHMEDQHEKIFAFLRTQLFEDEKTSSVRP